MPTTLYVKNMVCNRCIMVVRQELEKLDLHPIKVTLGEVILDEDRLNETMLNKVDSALLAVGFERMDDRKIRTIEAIKKKIIETIHRPDRIDLKVNWSRLLSDALHYEYNYLSNLFSSVEGVTIEHYIIHQKIERVKELLFYDELTLSQIADRLGYSSVSHLSAQFKKITGLTPSELKKSRTINQSRKPLDSL